MQLSQAIMNKVADWFSVNLDEIFEEAKKEGGEVAKASPTRVDLIFDDHSVLRITVLGIYAINDQGEMTDKRLFEDDDG
jgi:catalase (peroxidase I)